MSSSLLRRYSDLISGRGTAFTAMAPGVLFLVPSGVGAAGGLVISNGSDDMYLDGLIIGFRIVSAFSIPRMFYLCRARSLSLSVSRALCLLICLID